ncbi:centromere protein L [Spea bombifrons]|uniref:centromere protein L n=1 Tax=Spea bombifrons TaxID=233779 RepID=UPI00234B2FFD|nr:centromere protein L [Spea bombifrons]
MQTPANGVPNPRARSREVRSNLFQSTGFTNTGLNSARRNTPFRQAPSKRRIPQSSPLEETLEPSRIAYLLNKQWNLYSVTPMHRFSHKNLKEYSRLLSAQILAEKQKGFAIEVGTEHIMKASFSYLPGLKGKERDPGAVLVQVSTKPQFSKAGAEDKIVWSGWFCCTFGDDEILEMLPDTMVCLPLFLVNGTESLTAIVGSWFQRSFDCCFSKLPISARDLAWMTAMWAGYEIHERVSATELVFSVPVEPHMDISYAIHPDDFRTLWNDIHKSEDEVTAEEVDTLFHNLYNHFFRHFKIHLSATQLTKVSTSVASAHCEGKIKFLSKEHLVRVLALLTELAVNNIPY